jgi:molecular chaperone DnaK
MSYGLGVDLGTTFTAAAVARDGRVEMATLGDHTDAVPSVVLVRDDGTVLTGGAAERRAMVEPDRVARSVKRRFGDPMPVILGGAPHPATSLIAYQLRDIVDLVSDREGGRPGTVTLTHPANWGPYKRELFAQVPRLAGLGEVHMLTEPEAAAAHYAHNDRLDPGALVAVYDLGGGTFDATVLRTTEHGFDILGRPEGIEGLGGLDFDEAVFAHVDQTLDGAVSSLDPADPRAISAVIRLRHECVTAKETLSADTETTIPVLLPELQTEVRLTRGEFEKMIRPAIEATIASLRRALQSARIDLPQLHTVLLVGGSSRIPMVAHLISAELGRPTSVDTHPKHAIALGAAAVGAGTTGVGAAATAAPARGRLTPPSADKAEPANIAALVPRMTAADTPTPAAPALTAPTRRRLPLMIGVLVLVAALAGGGTVAERTLSNSTPTTSHQPTRPASHRSSGRSGTTTSGGSGTTTTGGGSGGTGSTATSVTTSPTSPPTSPTTPPTSPTTPVTSPTTPVTSPTTPLTSPTTPLTSPTTPLTSPTTPLTSPTTPETSPTTPATGPSAG